MIDGKRCILLVDDEEKMVRVLKDFLQANQFHIMQAYNGEEALACYYDHHTEIDLVLLDVMMPICNGFQVLKEIRQNESMTPVIMLTAREGEEDQIRGLQNGVDDYILKSFSPTILLARIETVLRRAGKDYASELTCGDTSIRVSTRRCCIHEKEIELTKREFDLLYYLMLNPAIAFTRDQLLNDVWGYNYEGEDRTVDTYVKQLRAKIRTSGNRISTVYGIGYKYEVICENSN
ncbi:MAG: response regulator transcription factor [Eubacteriales bacterium]